MQSDSTFEREIQDSERRSYATAGTFRINAPRPRDAIFAIRKL